MTGLTIYHNPKYSKSREMLASLEGRGVTPRIVEYLKTPPTAGELQEIIAKIGIRPEQLVRGAKAAIGRPPDNVLALLDP